VSGSQRRRSGGPATAKGPAPADAIVAVLERHGRFLTAEPLFPRPDSPSDGQRRRSSAKITLKSPHRGAGAPTRAGELVLIQPAGHGSGPRIVRVLGRPDVARDVIEGLMLDRGLARGFTAAVEREARAAGERVHGDEGSRRDLRELPTFTIDPASARDFDDAISAEALADGVTRVWVHIADVAAHVPEGSPLDREARRRATSVYVPGAVEPMLPHALSSDACSLMPGVERLAVTVELELRGAVVQRAAFYRSLIRSDERLDYERVDRIFAGAESAAEPWREPLAAARRVAVELQSARERSGALVVDSAEPEFSFDEHGNVAGIDTRVQSESHRLIEHLMIAANEAVAGLLAQRGVPCLYRVHERPQPERVERLADQLASLEIPTPPLPDHMSATQAAELIGEMSRRVEQHVRRSGHGRLAFGSLVLRSLKQAYYSPTNLGHAGLRSTTYCHFTSPIRRYPDIVCHRALLSAVGAGEREPRAGELVELGAWTSERERHAMVVERDADDVARCFALEQLLFRSGVGQVFAGEITGLISAGAFIAFASGGEDAGPNSGAGQEAWVEPEAGEDALAAAGAGAFEGMLPVRMLRVPSAGRTSVADARERGRPAGGARSGAGRGGKGGGGRGGGGRQGGSGGPGRQGGAWRGGSERDGERDWWELNEEGTILRGERTGTALRLGDAIEVRVARVDTIRGRVDLVPAG
jgi:ribonuclease R